MSAQVFLISYRVTPPVSSPRLSFLRDESAHGSIIMPDKSVVVRGDMSEAERILRAQANAVPQMLWTSVVNGGVVFADKRLLD